MSKKDIQHNIVNAIPYARRYGRALTGDANLADLVLTQASVKLIKKSPLSAVLLPEKMILPLLLMEFHRILDSENGNPASNPTISTEALLHPKDELLHEKIDRALCNLTQIQRRVFLLTALEQLRPNVISRILSLPVIDVKRNFQQAHVIVNEYVAKNTYEQAA